MDERTDPVMIIADVGRLTRKQRALEVWAWKAGQAGWAVQIVESYVDEPGDELGIVEVEGLHYRINFSPRIRQKVIITDPGQHPVAAIVDVVTGKSAPAGYDWEFAPAVWAEPVEQAD